MLDVQVLTTREELVSLRGDWAKLQQASHTNELAQSPDWTLAWWDVFGPQGASELCVCAIWEDERLIGLVPLRTRRHYYRQTLPFRRIELLASGEPEEDEISSEYLGMLAVAGKERLVADEFVRQLSDGRFGDWDELVCTRLRTDSPSSTALIRALRGHGTDVMMRSQGTCHFAKLPATWDEYLDGLPSRHRYMVRRSLRDLDAFSGGAYQLHSVTTRAELERGFDILVALHSERWAANSQTGVFNSRRFTEFHRSAMDWLLDTGALRLYWLEAAGEPVAAVYNIVWNNKIYFYQSGRKMDVPKKLKPGIALHALAIQHAIDEGLGEYDFLGGRAQYKAQLSTHSRKLVELRVVPRASVREPVRQLTEAGISAVQGLRNRIRRRRSDD